MKNSHYLLALELINQLDPMSPKVIFLLREGVFLV